MSLDPQVLLAIGAMALAIYATRAGGYLIFRIMKVPPIVREGLAYVPGALFVSYVVPSLAAGGLKEWLGAVATLGLVVVTRQVPLAILGGTAMAWGVWALR